MKCLSATLVLLTISVILGLDLCLAFRSDNRVADQKAQWNGTDQTQLVGADNKNSTTCSPWKYDKYKNSSCVCGANIHGIITCYDNQPTVLVLTCNCMTLSHRGSETVVGACPYLCTNEFYTKIYDYTNLGNICNHDIHQNRQGQMCGQCLENYSPSPYSYRLKCVHCSNHKLNWIKYLLMAYLPLTTFFVVVIFFRINVLSASMNAFILCCQIISCPSMMSIFSTFAYFTKDHPVHNHLSVINATKVMSTLFGVWNLDFFRMVYEPFCLHPNLSIIQIMSLDYAIAVYPLLLIVLTYFLVKLYESFKVIQFLWRPVVWLSNLFNHQWRASNSLIEVFATFILLSYVKIINTSFDILMPVEIYNITAKSIGLYLYYNGSMEYFGHEHLPYAVLAIFMFVTFNLLPLFLLCLYPCRCFQSCLNCYRLNSQVLRTFMDAFQGCYKFKPYDCRYWAAFYLSLRIAALAIFAATQSGYFALISGILLIPVIAVIAVIRPYRESVYNVVDVVLLLSLVLQLFSGVGFSLTSFDRRYEGLIVVTFAAGLITPMIYIVVLTAQKILTKLWNTYLKKLTLRVFKNRDSSKGTQGDEDLDDPLLHQVADSSESDMLISYQDTPHLLGTYTMQ